MSSPGTLWMGDIESWMDENFIKNIYEEKSKKLK